MYHKGFSEEQKREIAALGLQPGDYGAEYADVDVWPDNWRYVKLFDAVGTQWRHGAAGPAGLDYVALALVFKHHGFNPDEWGETFDLIQMMEAEALKQIYA